MFDKVIRQRVPSSFEMKAACTSSIRSHALVASLKAPAEAQLRMRLSSNPPPLFPPLFMAQQTYAICTSHRSGCSDVSVRA